MKIEKKLLLIIKRKELKKEGKKNEEKWKNKWEKGKKMEKRGKKEKRKKNGRTVDSFKKMARQSTQDDCSRLLNSRLSWLLNSRWA